MTYKLSYSLMADWKGGITDQVDSVRNVAAKLALCGVSSIHIDRDRASDPGVYMELCDHIIRRGILPIMDIYPGDPGAPMRNLAEVCCLGVLPLTWVDGKPSFDWNGLFETINGAGRFRFPLDLVLDFGAQPPEMDSITTSLPQLETLSRKYGLIQTVKLVSPDIKVANSDTGQKITGLFRNVLKACPSAKGSVSPEIWNEFDSFRTTVDDLGLLKVDIDFEKPGPQDCATEVLKLLSGIPDLDLTPRLPLLQLFYRKRWFSFEVGKVMDSWVDKKTFKYYAERPGWL
jgi:hypothetical protein